MLFFLLFDALKAPPAMNLSGLKTSWPGRHRQLLACGGGTPHDQPAFSRRIRALEEWLGADLFDRSTQPARLTEVGEWFRRSRRTCWRSGARAGRGQGRRRGQFDRRLRFAATHALSFTFLPRWLRALESLTALGPVQLIPTCCSGAKR